MTEREATIWQVCLASAIVALPLVVVICLDAHNGWNGSWLW